MTEPRTEAPVWKRTTFWISALLILIAIVGAVILIMVSSSRTLSSLENTLLQVLIMAAGLSGSYLFG